LHLGRLDLRPLRLLLLLLLWCLLWLLRLGLLRASRRGGDDPPWRRREYSTCGFSLNFRANEVAEY
jgi:hypothetical protein